MRTRDGEAGSNSTRLRLWNTLAFRTGVLINVTVVLVLGASEALNFRRERRAQIDQEIGRLREEANLLAVARKQISSGEPFQEYVDAFCRQMGSTTSPGHHIIFLDDRGKTVMKAHERADSELENRMTDALRNGHSTLQHGGADYLVVGKATDEGSTIVIAQSLQPIEKMIRAQGVNHAIGVVILVLLISVATTIGLFVWVRKPLRTLVAGVAAIGQREFDVHVQSSGSSELRFLADGINEMARSLGRVEAVRRAEMTRARAIQHGLLPNHDEHIEGFDFSAVFLPTATVGGDLYDVVKSVDGSTLLAVLDVSGHGVPAALYTALLRTVLHHEATNTSDLKRVADAMNKELCQVTDAGDFATCFLIRIPRDMDSIEYLSAGHDAGLLVRQDCSTDTLSGSAGLPFGIEPGAPYQISTAPISSGDRIFVFTDGLHEVFNTTGEVLGRQRLAAMLAEDQATSLKNHLAKVIERVQSFQRRPAFDDDITLICASRK